MRAEILLNLHNKKGKLMKYSYNIEAIGYSVFFGVTAKEEAEVRLKELKGEKE